MSVCDVTRPRLSKREVLAAVIIWRSVWWENLTIRSRNLQPPFARTVTCPAESINTFPRSIATPCHRRRKSSQGNIIRQRTPKYQQGPQHRKGQYNSHGLSSWSLPTLNGHNDTFWRWWHTAALWYCVTENFKPFNPDFCSQYQWSHISTCEQNRGTILQTASDEPSPILCGKITKKMASTKGSGRDILLRFCQNRYKHWQQRIIPAAWSSVTFTQIRIDTSDKQLWLVLATLLKKCSTPEWVWRFSKRRSWGLRSPGIIVFHIFISI